MTPLENNYWVGIHRAPEGEEDRSKPRKDGFEGNKKMRQKWNEVNGLTSKRGRWKCCTNAVRF